MPRYVEPEVRYCNRARAVLLIGCLAVGLLFYGLIQALAPKPLLRIKLDKDAELVALKLDLDGDGKISTSDIIKALAGDEKELEALETELIGQSLEFSVKLRGKDADIKKKAAEVEELKSACVPTARALAGRVWWWWRRRWWRHQRWWW